MLCAECACSDRRRGAAGWAGANGGVAASTQWPAPFFPPAPTNQPSQWPASFWPPAPTKPPNISALSECARSRNPRYFQFSSLHCKKMLPVFPSPGGVSLTKLSLAGNNLIFPGQGEFDQRHSARGSRWSNSINFFTVWKYCPSRSDLK